MNIGQFLHEQEKRIQEITTFYGITRRAASFLVGRQLLSKEQALQFLAKYPNHLSKFKGVGPATATEIYNWLGLEEPEITKYTCPKCGHKFN